jgi:hypothetical protein
MNKYQAHFNFLKLVNDNGGYYDWDNKSNYITMANGNKYFFKQIPWFKMWLDGYIQ